jgi:hypothetical protein
MSPDEQEDTRSENEIFYDEQIAPMLLMLSRQCQALGIPFVCSVEYDPGSGGTTAYVPDKADFDSSMLTYFAARSKGNMDTLGMSWSEYCKKNNRAHNSIVLKYLGLDPDPSKR